MDATNIKALCFDTGGTILDWHTGMRTALADVGARHGMHRVPDPVDGRVSGLAVRSGG